MKATFIESSILICVPTMIFATSFALALDVDGTLSFKEDRKLFTLGRLLVGLSLSLSVDLLLSHCPLWNPTYQSNQFGTIFFIGYLFPYILTTFVVFGLTPPLTSALFFNHHNH